ENLSAMCCREQARSAVEERPNIVVAALLHHPAIECHPHLEASNSTPIFGDQQALSGECGCQSRRRRREGGLEAMADHLIEMAAVRCDDPAHDRFMPLECVGHLGGVLFPEASAAHDVCKQKGHGPTWSKKACRAWWWSIGLDIPRRHGARNGVVL